MGLSIVFVVGGLLLLVVGGEALLRGAVRIAEFLRLTPAVIGLTVVSAATSVPELAVSIGAAFSGRVDIAVGNVVGSNIANIALILGLSAAVRPLAVSGNMIRLEYPVMWLVTLLLVVLALDGTISRPDGAFMIVAYVLFTSYVIALVRDRLGPEEKSSVAEEVSESSAQGSLARACGLVCLAVILLWLGADLTVTGSVDIAKLLGVSDRVIGLTIVAVGTSLPEIVASSISAYRGRGDIAIGNVVGSNIFNILIILGLSGLANPLSVNPQMISTDFLWMMGTASVLFPLMFSRRMVSRSEGWLLLGIYGCYLGSLLFWQA